MNGRNLLVLACSGLALTAVVGCAHDAPRASIKDTVAAEPSSPPARSRVRSYMKRAEPGAAPARASVTAEEPAVPAPRTAAVELAPATRAIPPPEVAPKAAPDPLPPPRVVNPEPKASEPPASPRIVNPPAKAAEPPIREAAAGTAAGPGTGLPAINGSGSLTSRIMEQARQRIAAGDVIRAREWLLSALNGARPEVLHELARTFDPNFLGRITQPNAVAEPVRARALYEEAIRLGAKGATDDLNSLLKTMSGQP